jgi:glycosyltransferase involved in cell wall biosynthesis
MVRMRICYLANAQSVHTQKWAKFFADKGHEVHLISFEGARIENVKVYSLKLSFVLRFGFDYLLKPVRAQIIKRLIGRINPDILHAHYFLDYGLYGALCGFKPFVVTSWGSDILVDPKKFVISKYAVKFVLRKADLITCDAEHMREALRRLGAAQEKIRLINFGVDTRKFSLGQKSEGLKAELGIYDSPTVISLRSLNPLYDIESLIKSIPMVLREIPNSKFVIAGRGSEETRLKELAKSLGVSLNTKFVGVIPNDELPEYLTTMDVYVSTALSDAGLSGSTAEAMACGLPVIVTDVADNRRWVADGVNGFVVPIKDPKSLAEKTIYLLKNEGVRKKFGKISREIIEKTNDYYKEMEKMERIYEELAKKHKK